MTDSATPTRPRVDVIKMIRGWWDIQPVMVPFLALVLSTIVGAILMAIVGVNPLDGYWALLRGMFDGWGRIAGSIAKSVPFIGSALALAFAMRAGLFNIGAEGQMLAGGLAAAWVGTWALLYDLPGILALPIIVLAGFAGGALWGGIPGVLRAKTGAHEVISTIMLNAVALRLAEWLVNSTNPVLLRDRSASVTRTRFVSPTARFGELTGSNPPLHLGLFLLVAVCILVWWLLRRTTFGFATITVGTNPHAAHYAGINVNRIIVAAMLLAGGFAGVSAVSEVAGTHHMFQPGAFRMLGFDGIAIALLARANPIGIVAASLLWGALRSGAPLMQQEADVSIDIVRIIQAMILLFVAADAIVRFVFRVRRTNGARAVTSASGWTA